MAVRRAAGHNREAVHGIDRVGLSHSRHGSSECGM
jgi:hypothetical protein